MAPAGSSHANLGLAGLCLAGGVMGYVKAKSTPSLIAGVSFAAAYGTAAYMINATDAAQGHLTGFVTSLALSGAMGARFVKTGKVMPAGVTMGAGVLGALYNWGKFKEWSS